MYRSSYDAEYANETNFIKRNVIWIVLVMMVIVGAGWFATRTSRVIDSAFINYEQFQEIYNTCKKIDVDMGVISGIPDNDPMFASFSKKAVLANKKQQLTRWIEEYNAKSKMWHRGMWKSSSLPYQLDVSQFPNFN